MKVCVTGGAGFIGSHLVDKLAAESVAVIVIDDLSSGKEENLNPEAVFIEADIRNDLSAQLEGVHTVFHMAAEPNVKASAEDPRKTFDINIEGTFNLLESCRKADIRHFVLASTSAVYGEAKLIPTPEDYHCLPISYYGASKLACEALLSAFCSTYGIKGTSLRFANIYGERSLRGVMYDFHRKLRNDPKSLEILGDGKQDKSYLHISDCVAGIMTAWKKQKKDYDVFNIGSRDKARIKDIAVQLSGQLGINPKLEFAGSRRGWSGDIPVMQLDVSKIEKLGWKQKMSFASGISSYVDWLSAKGQ